MVHRDTTPLAPREEGWALRKPHGCAAFGAVRIVLPSGSAVDKSAFHNPRDLDSALLRPMSLNLR